LLKVINSPELAAVSKKILDNPDDASLYNERARIYMQFKQFNEAINDAKRSIRIDSTNATYYLTEADVFLLLMKLEMQKMFLKMWLKNFRKIRMVY